MDMYTKVIIINSIILLTVSITLIAYKKSKNPVLVDWLIDAWSIATLFITASWAVYKIVLMG